jgi:hypothetical protein
MSAAPSWTCRSEALADEVREVVREHVRMHGWKRGLFLFATRCGVTERRAKALYTGEPLKLLAHEWHAAMDARMTLRRERAAAIRRELAELERGLDVEMAAQGVGVGR